MTTVTAPAGTRAGRAQTLAVYLAAAAFAVSAAWYALIAEHVTVAAPPAGDSLRDFYTWFAGTLPQERLDTGLGIVAMLCLVPVAGLLRDLFGRAAPAAGWATSALALGAVVWSTGNLLQLGGHRAVGLMATHANPIETVNAIAFTVDTVDEAFEVAGFLLLGAGLLGLAALAARRSAVALVWTGATAVTGVVLLLLAFAYLAGTDGPATWLLAAAGVLVLPAWLLLTARLGSAGSGE
jgi:hypothetical protein